MAKIEEAFDILMKLEFSSTNIALHKNKTEGDMTYKGIYRIAHPDWNGWNYVDDGLRQNDFDYKHTSVYLEQYKSLQEEVKNFYKSKFWDRAKLDEVNSQKIANEIFIFGVNVGMRNAIRKAQKLAKVPMDGIVGPMTLQVLNILNEADFDYQFDELEKQYYSDIIKKKPYLAIYKNGWFHRAEAV